MLNESAGLKVREEFIFKAPDLPGRVRTKGTYIAKYPSPYTTHIDAAPIVTRPSGNDLTRDIDSPLSFPGHITEGMQVIVDTEDSKNPSIFAQTTDGPQYIFSLVPGTPQSDYSYHLGVLSPSGEAFYSKREVDANCPVIRAIGLKLMECEYHRVSPTPPSPEESVKEESIIDKALRHPPINVDKVLEFILHPIATKAKEQYKAGEITIDECHEKIYELITGDHLKQRDKTLSGSLSGGFSEVLESLAQSIETRDKLKRNIPWLAANDKLVWLPNLSKLGTLNLFLISMEMVLVEKEFILLFMQMNEDGSVGIFAVPMIPVEDIDAAYGTGHIVANIDKVSYMSRGNFRNHKGMLSALSCLTQFAYPNYMSKPLGYAVDYIKPNHLG